MFVMCSAAAQNPDAGDKPSERWNLYFQATSIGDYHGNFPALYSGEHSLQNTSERDVSLTSTLYWGFACSENTQIYIDPEIAGGRGFSGVNGVANSPNGELPRVASATPKPYLARAYITHDFGFGSEREDVSSDENQLAGSRPMTRYSITAGRFTVTDFFDNNRYTHDPRTQFMGWGVMYNGAWDYPADVRGYTWGWMHEFHTRRWSVRYASAAEPASRMDCGSTGACSSIAATCSRAKSIICEGEHPGTLRLLGFVNHADAGNYAEALRLGATDRNRAGRHRHAPQRHVEVRNRREPRAADHQGHGRVRASGLERRQNGKLRVHRHRSSGDRRSIRRGPALEAAGRHRGERAHGQRPFRRACFVSGARRPGFSDRRWRAAIRSRVRLGKLLQRALVWRLLRELSICSTSPIRPTTRIAARCGSPACACIWSSNCTGLQRTRSDSRGNSITQSLVSRTRS